MIEILRKHAEHIARSAIATVLPDVAVKEALEGIKFPGSVYVVAVGKAAWQMANSATACLSD